MTGFDSVADDLNYSKEGKVRDLRKLPWSTAPPVSESDVEEALQHPYNQPQGKAALTPGPKAGAQSGKEDNDSKGKGKRQKGKKGKGKGHKGKAQKGPGKGGAAGAGVRTVTVPG